MTSTGLISRTLAACATLAIAACTQPVDVPDRERRPELVKPGMSLRQVEALVGQSDKQPCWNYQRNGAAERVCFVDAMANFYNKSPLVEADPTRITIDGWFANEWPPKRLPSPTATEVTLGTSQKRVEELWGAPMSIDDTFSTPHGPYRGTFVRGRLTRFEAVPLPPVP